MKFIEFKKALEPFPVFSVTEIKKVFPAFDTRRLVEWQQKGYLEKLRNNYYCFPPSRISEQTLFKAANVMVHPSYVSLESALWHYGFIPEGVFRTISCTTLKTQHYTNHLGLFDYRHVKAGIYFGYGLDQWDHYRFAIADPEKTLIDYCYLNTKISDPDDFAELRWNRSAILDRIDLYKLRQYERLIHSPNLSLRLKILRDYLHVKSE